MPSIHELTVSKYLTKEDCGPGILLTIAGLSRVNMAREGDPQDMKYILQFREAAKPLVLNATNGAIIAAFIGSEEMNDWIGRQIVAFHDPSVMFGKRIVGGIKVRAPKFRNAVPAQTPAPYIARQQAEDIHGQVPIPQAGAPFQRFAEDSRSDENTARPLAPAAPSDEDIPF